MLISLKPEGILLANQSTTRHFKTDKFNHVDLINQTALDLLDEIREQFGRSLIVTDDARLPTELPEGTSGPEKSLHYKGQAFDLRIRDFSEEDLWSFVATVINVATWVCRGAKAGVELEIVWSKTDKHAHIAFFLGDGRKNRFLVRSE